MNCVEILVIINIVTDSGASFCHDVRINAAVHEIDVITEGYHIWHGARPILIMRDKIKIILIIDDENEELYMRTPAIRSSLDPRACASIYLIEASVSWLLLDLRRMGINDRRLSSRAIHNIIQLDLDITINVLDNRTM